MDQFIPIIAMLSILIGMSLALELGLSKILFEREWYRSFLEGKGLKTPIALGLAWVICYRLDFDIVSIILTPGWAVAESTGVGVLFTAAVVAGGRALTLFRQIMRLREITR